MVDSRRDFFKALSGSRTLRALGGVVGAGFRFFEDIHVGQTTSAEAAGLALRGHKRRMASQPASRVPSGKRGGDGGGGPEDSADHGQ